LFRKRDHLVGTGDWHIGERQAVDIDAQRGKIGRDQSCAELRRHKAGVTVLVV
jgi:hypothetical protein